MATTAWVPGVNKPPVGTKVLVLCVGGWRRGTVKRHDERKWVVYVELEIGGGAKYDSRQLLDGWELPKTGAFGGWAYREFA